MELYPRSAQVEWWEELLSRWDVIVGHHSHCPQPVASHAGSERRQLIAYSLGDFTSGLKLPSYRSGIVLKMDVGPDRNGRWQVGDVQWRPTRVDLVRHSVDIDERDPTTHAPPDCSVPRLVESAPPGLKRRRMQ